LHIKRALTLQYQGKLPSAAREIEVALAKHPPTEKQDRLAMVALWISIDILSRIPEVDPARQQLSELERLCAAVGTESDSIRMDWLKARIAFEAGEPERALVLYQSAADAWASLGHGYKWSLVALEKALVHLAAGDTTSVRELAAQALPSLSSWNASVDVMAVFKLLGSAHHIDTDLVRTLLDRLERLPRRSHQE
jgi:hypothetical protein